MTTWVILTTFDIQQQSYPDVYAHLDEGYWNGTIIKEDQQATCCHRLSSWKWNATNQTVLGIDFVCICYHNRRERKVVASKYSQFKHRRNTLISRRKRHKTFFRLAFVLLATFKSFLYLLLVSSFYELLWCRTDYRLAAAGLPAELCWV